MLNIPIEKGGNLKSMNELLVTGSSNMLSLLDNTDLFAQIEKIQPKYVNDSQTINVTARINTEIKLFLSVPVYQQILATVKYSTTNTSSNVSTQPSSLPTTPMSSAASSETSLSISVSAERY